MQFAVRDPKPTPGAFDSAAKPSTPGTPDLQSGPASGLITVQSDDASSGPPVPPEFAGQVYSHFAEPVGSTAGDIDAKVGDQKAAISLTVDAHVQNVCTQGDQAAADTEHQITEGDAAHKAAAPDQHAPVVAPGAPAAPDAQAAPVKPAPATKESLEADLAASVEREELELDDSKAKALADFDGKIDVQKAILDGAVLGGDATAKAEGLVATQAQKSKSDLGNKLTVDDDARTAHATDLKAKAADQSGQQADEIVAAGEADAKAVESHGATDGATAFFGFQKRASAALAQGNADSAAASAKGAPQTAVTGILNDGAAAFGRLMTEGAAAQTRIINDSKARADKLRADAKTRAGTHKVLATVNSTSVDLANINGIAAEAAKMTSGTDALDAQTGASDDKMRQDAEDGRVKQREKAAKMVEQLEKERQALSDRLDTQIASQKKSIEARAAAMTKQVEHANPAHLASVEASVKYTTKQIDKASDTVDASAKAQIAMAQQRIKAATAQTVATMKVYARQAMAKVDADAKVAKDKLAGIATDTSAQMEQSYQDSMPALDDAAAATMAKNAAETADEKKELVKEACQDLAILSSEAKQADNTAQKELDDFKTPPDPQAVADTSKALFKAMDGWGTDEDAILNALRGKNAKEIQAIREKYAEMHPGHDLDADLEDELSGPELRAAQAAMANDHVAEATAAMDYAADGLGTNEQMMKDTLEQLPANEREAMIKGWGATHDGQTMDAMLQDEMSTSGTDYQETAALAKGDIIEARAVRAYDAMDGLGTNEAKLNKALEDCKNQAERQAVIDKFAEVARRNGTDMTFHEMVADEESGSEADVTNNLEKGDLAGAAAAKLKVAADGLGTDEKAMFSQFENKPPKEFQGTPAEWRKLITEKYDGQYGPNSPAGGDSMMDMAKDELGDMDVERFKQDVSDGKMRPGFALYYAMEGLGTNDEMVKSTLTDENGKPLSKDKIAALKAEFAKEAAAHGESDTDLESWTKDEMSGREGFDVAQDLKGAPTTPEEKLERMREADKFENNGELSGVTDVFSDSGNVERKQLQLAEAALARSNDPNLSAEERAKAKTEFDNRSDDFSSNVDEHRAAQDQVTTAAAIVVATIVTVATAGTAGPVGAALLGAAASIATKQLIKGDAYSQAEMGVDIGIGIGTACIAGAGSLLPGVGEVAGEAAEIGAEGLAEGAQVAEQVGADALKVGASTAAHEVVDEGVQVAAKEAIQEGGEELAKEGAKQATKTAIEEGAAKGATEVGKDAVETGAKGLADKGATEAAQEGLTEASKQGLKDAAAEGVKEGAEEVGKQGAKEGAKEGAEEAARTLPRRVLDEAIKTAATNAGNTAVGELFDKRLWTGDLSVVDALLGVLESAAAGFVGGAITGAGTLKADTLGPLMKKITGALTGMSAGGAQTVLQGIMAGSIDPVALIAAMAGGAYAGAMGEPEKEEIAEAEEHAEHAEHKKNAGNHENNHEAASEIAKAKGGHEDVPVNTEHTTPPPAVDLTPATPATPAATDTSAVAAHPPAVEPPSGVNPTSEPPEPGQAVKPVVTDPAALTEPLHDPAHAPQAPGVVEAFRATPPTPQQTEILARAEELRAQPVVSVEEARALQASAAEHGVPTELLPRASSIEDILRARGMTPTEIEQYKATIGRDQQSMVNPEWAAELNAKDPYRQIGETSNQQSTGVEREAATPAMLNATLKANILLFDEMNPGTLLTKVIPEGGIGGLLAGETVGDNGQVRSSKMAGDFTMAATTEGTTAEQRVQNNGLDYKGSPFTERGPDGTLKVTEQARERIFVIEQGATAEQVGKAQVPMGPDMYSVALMEGTQLAEAHRLAAAGEPIPERLHALDENGNLKPIPKLLELDENGMLKHVVERVRGDQNDPSAGFGGTASQELRNESGGMYYSPNQEVNAGANGINAGAEMAMIGPDGSRLVVARWDGTRFVPVDGLPPAIADMMDQQLATQQATNARNRAAAAAADNPAHTGA